MLTLSADALALIAARQSPIFIDIPHTVSGCCFEVSDCPAVRLGEPKDLSGYNKQTLQQATVYVPKCFPEDGDHVVRVSSFLGFSRLVLGGWRLI